MRHPVIVLCLELQQHEQKTPGSCVSEADFQQRLQRR